MAMVVRREEEKKNGIKLDGNTYWMEQKRKES